MFQQANCGGTHLTVYCSAPNAKGLLKWYQKETAKSHHRDSLLLCQIWSNKCLQSICSYKVLIFTDRFIFHLGLYWALALCWVKDGRAATLTISCENQYKACLWIGPLPPPPPYPTLSCPYLGFTAICVGLISTSVSLHSVLVLSHFHSNLCYINL